MFVKKFSADTLDEALKTVKKELGPDAIILKTTSNKSTKGMLKRKKIEITAAVTEKEYVKKSKVDAALPKEAKENFYNGSASSVSESINDYNSHLEKNKSGTSKFINGGYGNLALNKMVKQNLKKSDLLNESNQSSNDLDSFLNTSDSQSEIIEAASIVNERMGHKAQSPLTTNNSESSSTTTINQENANDINFEGLERIIKLEAKISKLSQDLTNLKNKKPEGLYNVQTNLRCLDISEKFIQNLNKRMCFELSREELDNYDITFDFALREILNQINCEAPLFAKREVGEHPIITVLISGKYSGQTTSLLKLNNFKKNSIVIAYKNNDLNEKHVFTSKTFNLDIKNLSTIAEVISECRKACAENKSVFIDYKIEDDNTENSRLFLDGLKKSFENVEILLCLSAIHSEKHNQKIISKHRDYINGIIVTYLDLCSSFGEIFNINYNYPNIPFKFYSTGAVVPDDIEPASAERIISGLFKL
ncbi:MAG: hypothetical protein HQK51_09055 [Oligoflexia bacterium]|nr:hypothetical protein [Oligoflexia bacterium]